MLGALQQLERVVEQLQIRAQAAFARREEFAHLVGAIGRDIDAFRLGQLPDGVGAEGAVEMTVELNLGQALDPRAVCGVGVVGDSASTLPVSRIADG